MKLKNVLCLILAGLMAASLLVACNRNQQDDPATEEKTEPKTDPPETKPQETEPDSEQSTPQETVTEGEPEDEMPEPLPTDRTYSILFIGNSYTKRNDMANSIFVPLAKKAGYRVEVTTILNGGHTLEAFANPSDTYGAVVAQELSAANKGKYDFVILQEQSLRPVTTAVGKFYDGARALAGMIREAGAVPVFYSTWGRKTGSADLSTYNMTNESMTWKLAAAYGAIGEELDAPVAHVGLAFFDVYTNATDIELYDSDLYHPVYTGSYLAAVTLFAKIFNVDPTTVNYDGTLESDEADVLREAARAAVFETPEIPEEYRTTTDDVFDDTTVATKNLSKLPDAELISILRGNGFANGKNFSGILGTKKKIASSEFSTTGLTDAQKADIADIGYGVSVIGIEKMNGDSKGYTTAVENLVNGHWGSSLMASLVFDDQLYDVNGNATEDGKYRALITLNFGRECSFNAIGFASGNLNGFPGAADVFVSHDGVNWTLVPSASWDKFNGSSISSCSDASSLIDPWNSNTAGTVCLFDMAEVEGVYVRIGVIIGRNDKGSMYNTINTREILVYGEYLEK